MRCRFSLQSRLPLERPISVTFLLLSCIFHLQIQLRDCTHAAVAGYKCEFSVCHLNKQFFNILMKCLASNYFPIFCRPFVQDLSLVIDNMIRAAVVLFTTLTIRSAKADPQVNILLLFSKIGINKLKLAERVAFHKEQHFDGLSYSIIFSTVWHSHKMITHYTQCKRITVSHWKEFGLSTELQFFLCI